MLEIKRRDLLAIIVIVLLMLIAGGLGKVMKNNGRIKEQSVDTTRIEQEYLTETRQLLTDAGYANSGVTMTKVTDVDGSQIYTMRIHNMMLAQMPKEKQDYIYEQLGQKCIQIDNASVIYEII